MYSAIAQSFSRMNEEKEKQRLRHKFDISYFIAIEKISFLKYPYICELKQRLGVDIGTLYVDRKAGASFIHYIAEARQQDVLKLALLVRQRFSPYFWMGLLTKAILTIS